MLHILHGPDDFSSAHAAEALVRALLAGEENYLSRQDGASTPWAPLRDSCYTISMFAPAQVILVRGLLGAWSGRTEGGAKAGNRPTPEQFAAFATDMPEATHLILVEGALTPTNRYMKEINRLPAAIAEVRVFQGLEGQALIRWLAQAVRERGGSIEGDAATALAARCEQDLRRISVEIDKLLSYTAPISHIRAQDVEQMVLQAEGASSFDLVDAISGRQAPRTVELVQRLLEMGEAPEAILALLGSRIRDLTLLKAAQDEGIADSAVASQLGWKPGRIHALQRGLREFTSDNLREAHSLLVATDAALKSRPTHERPTILLLTVLAIAMRKGTRELERALVL